MFVLDEFVTVAQTFLEKRMWDALVFVQLEHSLLPA